MAQEPVAGILEQGEGKLPVYMYSGMAAQMHAGAVGGTIPLGTQCKGHSCLPTNACSGTMDQGLPACTLKQERDVNG